MKRYNDDLAPHEINKGFYRNIELGKDVVLQKIEISNQIRGMIVSCVGLSSTSNTNKAAINASINLLAYDNRNVSSGIYGLKASFEWNISEVVWQLEQNIQEFKDMLEILYASQEPSYAGMRRMAQEDYENGRIPDAIRNFLKLSQCFKDDFSVFLSLGLISLFHEEDKEKALEYFDESLEIAKSQSDFYTSYVLLHKALVLRNLNRLEEAEEFSKQAVDLSPDLTEALYQNAQYSALLKKTDTAISLLKKIIRVDILYCLKIANERDFDGIRSHTTKIFKEIGAQYHESIETKMKVLDKKLDYFDGVISRIHKQGLDISGNQNIRQRQEDRAELANMIDCDFVLNTFVVDNCLTQLDKNFRDDKLLLSSECKKIRSKVGSERKEAARTLKKVKERKLFYPFLLYLFISQICAIPVGLFVVVPHGILITKYNRLIGASTGIPPGVFLLEFIAFISCVLIVIVPTIRPRIKWKKIHARLQQNEYALDKTIKIIEKELRN